MKKLTKKTFFSILITLLPVAAISATDGLVSAAVACSYYASPNGGGNGLSQSSPFRIANFWNVAAPGKTLCLLDGQYTGSASMINPPQNLSGTANAPITVRALNDGKVTINGQSVNNPVRLSYNNHFVLQGFNAYHSKGTVVDILRSNYNIVRRVAAWDAADGNTNIFGVHYSSHNVLEDVAGWGVARKTFSGSQGGNYLTIRRAWGMWNRSSSERDGKMVFTTAYNNYGAICENCIATWDEDIAPSNALRGLFTNDHMRQTDPSYDKCSKSKYLGSIGYIRGTQKVSLFNGVMQSSSAVDCVTFDNIVAYIEPGKHSGLKTASLNPLTLSQGGPSQGNHVVKNTTEIGGAPASIGNDWTVSNRIVVNSLAAAPNIWNGSGSSGARVCKRYENGKLTNTPLWPWPMNQRIIDALKQASRTPVDVTKTMEEIFGPIPSECRGGVSTPSSGSGSQPDAPVNLNISTGG